MKPNPVWPAPPSCSGLKNRVKFLGLKLFVNQEKCPLTIISHSIFLPHVFFYDRKKLLNLSVSSHPRYW
uniref:Uncharacterized protein n=1 Tax=Klebsiella pneumoniae TaxID=573 RepID=A0A8B0SRL9_KLEPN|nr:hypothetical protein [Klebsiella pneumoniae]